MYAGSTGVNRAKTRIGELDIMRPIWNGTLAFGLVVIPVRLYAATERRNISFNWLHSRCNSPVKYQKWCLVCQAQLEPEEIVKAYEYEKGQYVVFTDEELEAMPGPDAHKVEILDFVNLVDVDPVYFEKSYFLEPREGAEKAYRLLLESMKGQGKVAVARVALRAKETLAVVRTYGDNFMMLETMYWPEEVRSGQGLKISKESGVDEREKKMAVTLIEALSSDFEPEKYKSRQKEAMAELIQKKIQGKEIIAEPERVPAQVIDLMEALRRSVEKAKTEKTGKGRPKGAVVGESGSLSDERYRPGGAGTGDGSGSIT